MQSLENFNKPGLTDAYNVLRILKDMKVKPINTRKGGKAMEDEKIDVPEENAETAQPISPETAEVETEDPALAEAEEDDSEVE